MTIEQLNLNYAKKTAINAIAGYDLIGIVSLLLEQRAEWYEIAADLAKMGEELTVARSQ